MINPTPMQHVAFDIEQHNRVQYAFWRGKVGQDSLCIQ